MKSDEITIPIQEYKLLYTLYLLSRRPNLHETEISDTVGQIDTLYRQEESDRQAARDAREAEEAKDR